MKSIRENNIYIQEIIQRTRLDENSMAVKARYPQKIAVISDAIATYAEPCKETGDFQKMLLELAQDLKKNENPQPAVRRSIEKRFKVMTKHLQAEHGLSTPNQYREAGATLGASLLGMFGFVMLALGYSFLFPIVGIVSGFFLGLQWGKSRDFHALKVGDVLEL